MAKIMPNPPAMPISMATAPFLISRLELCCLILSPVCCDSVPDPFFNSALCALQRRGANRHDRPGGAAITVMLGGITATEPHRKLGFSDQS
jgi:hypothetical protein